MPFLSLLCCQHYGLPAESADFLVHFLRTAEYHVCTCFGTSDDFFTHVIQAIFGVLQGSGSGSTIWLSLSLILIKTF